MKYDHNRIEFFKEDTERCFECKGTGRGRCDKWNKEEERWATFDTGICEDCKGSGIRKFKLYSCGTNFMYTKIYDDEVQ